jgi:hypothetical protein
MSGRVITPGCPPSGYPAKNWAKKSVKKLTWSLKPGCQDFQLSRDQNYQTCSEGKKYLHLDTSRRSLLRGFLTKGSSKVHLYQAHVL